MGIIQHNGLQGKEHKLKIYRKHSIIRANKTKVGLRKMQRQDQ